jgi:Protein of unknown function (DUF2934)
MVQRNAQISGVTESTKDAIFIAGITAAERERRVREAAYFRAERRGFVGGSAEQDWIDAEREIDLQMAEQSWIVEHRRETSPLDRVIEREQDIAPTRTASPGTDKAGATKKTPKPRRPKS